MCMTIKDKDKVLTEAFEVAEKKGSNKSFRCFR